MSAYCPGCGTQHDEDDDRLRAKCVEKNHCEDAEATGEVTVQEARAIAQRFINGHFNNAGKEHPRVSIPADPKRDDDIRLMAFITQAVARRGVDHRETIKLAYARLGNLRVLISALVEIRGVSIFDDMPWAEDMLRAAGERELADEVRYLAERQMNVRVADCADRWGIAAGQRGQGTSDGGSVERSSAAPASGGHHPTPPAIGTSSA